MERIELEPTLSQIGASPETQGRPGREHETSPPATVEEIESFRLYRRVRSSARGPLGALIVTAMRRKISERYLSLVTRVSRQQRFRRFAASVSEEELQSAGACGLLKAIDMFDESVGRSFVAYAGQRIRGEMLDMLRDYDPLSREVRRFEREVGRLRQELGRTPDDDEQADGLGVTVDRVRELRSASRAMSHQSLDELVMSGDDSAGMRRGDMIGDEVVDDPHEHACSSELIELCRKRLSGREAKVFFENAFGDRSLKEIGDELGISESRACQIRRGAREKLAQFLVGRGEVDEGRLDDL